MRRAAYRHFFLAHLAVRRHAAERVDQMIDAAVRAAVATDATNAELALTTTERAAWARWVGAVSASAAKKTAR